MWRTFGRGMVILGFVFLRTDASLGEVTDFTWTLISPAMGNAIWMVDPKTGAQATFYEHRPSTRSMRLIIREPSKKMDHVVRPEPVGIPNIGDHVFAANKKVLSHIPEGLVAKLIARSHDQHERQFAELLNQRGMHYLGWMYTIKTIEASGSRTSTTVLVTPRIADGGASTVALGGIEEVFRFENGELTLVSGKVKGSPTSYIRD